MGCRMQAARLILVGGVAGIAAAWFLDRLSGNSTLLPSASEKYREETIKVRKIPPIRAISAR